MGVIFQNGMAIGGVPGFSNYGIPRGWLLGIEDFGCQPAWDNGVMTVIPYFTSGCLGTTNFFNAFSGNPNFGFYVNGKDSTGTNQTAFLSQVIGNAGTMTFSQLGSSVTIGFDETTFALNTYGDVDGIYYDMGVGTPPYYISGTGAFYGFNNAGNGTNSTGGSGEAYFTQPLNTQVLVVTINIGVTTPTPTPTATSTPTPQPTSTPTPTPTGGASYYTYSWDIDTLSGGSDCSLYPNNPTTYYSSDASITLNSTIMYSDSALTTPIIGNYNDGVNVYYCFNRPPMGGAPSGTVTQITSC